MPGRTDKPLELPTLLYTDTFRATPAVLEEMLNIYKDHTHKDLIDALACVVALTKSAQDKTRELLSHQIGAIRSVSVRRDGGQDATSFTEDDDDIPSELSIPVAVENPVPNTTMTYRFAAVVESSGDANITVIKTKKRAVIDQDGGDS